MLFLMLIATTKMSEVLGQIGVIAVSDLPSLNDSKWFDSFRSRGNWEKALSTTNHRANCKGLGVSSTRDCLLVSSLLGRTLQGIVLDRCPLV